MVFLHTKFGGIAFLSSQYCTSWATRWIKSGLEMLKNEYEVRKSEITDYHSNNGLNITELNEFLKPSTLHVYAKYEHVGPIEREIFTFKECIRSDYHSVP